MILDVMLPKLSGVEVCREDPRAERRPGVMLTARTAEIDRVVGLEAGADDYVSKPFSMAELISRVRAILRRRSLDRDVDASVREVGPLRLDLLRQTLVVDGRLVDVTPSEFRILALLARQPDRAVSRREIVEHLWRSSARRRRADVRRPREEPPPQDRARPRPSGTARDRPRRRLHAPRGDEEIDTSG